MEIRKTGLQDYVDGSGNLKMLLIGAPGAGKTRFSSFWPKPIYADCEEGRASIADREVPYVQVKTSHDMLDLLEYLKKSSATPKKDREYQTLVIDTVDAFQRKLREEWMEQTGSGVFSGYDAWNFIDQKMQMLITRMLNLDLNVIVLAHYKQAIIRDADGQEVSTIQLQLDGSQKEKIFNEFDLVGRIGTYWEAEEGERVQKRGMTFTPTPDMPFLKDRLHITPKWMPVEFADEDYEQFVSLLKDRMPTDLSESTVIGEVPKSEEEMPEGVSKPKQGGPVKAKPETKAAKTPSKDDLMKEARKLGWDVPGNTTKAELERMVKSGPPKKAAVENVQEALGGEVIAEIKQTCADCEGSLEGVREDIAKLSHIRFRTSLCEDCFAKRNQKK